MCAFPASRYTQAAVHVDQLFQRKNAVLHIWSWNLSRAPALLDGEVTKGVA